MKTFFSTEIKKVVVDGAVYSNQKVGGVSRLFTEIMPRICDYDENVWFQLLLNKKNIQPLPRHEHIFYQYTYKIESLLHPRRLWRSYRTAIKDEINIRLIGDSRKKIWHSTYYTLPGRWKGAVVITAYDMIYERYKESFFSNLWGEEDRKNMRNAILHADKIISISLATKDDLINILDVDDKKIQVIHLACSPLFQKMPDDVKLTRKPFVLYVGSRAIYKNFTCLLQAFSIWTKNSDVELVAVGPDWSDEETKTMTELNLSEKVRLVSYPDDIVLRNLYNQAMAFVYPSLYEGFGIPLLEAMSCGCPVIASKIPSTIEVAGDVPIYHEPGNVEQLLLNLDQSYNEAKSFERILSGLNRAKLFSWEFTARQTAEVYRNLLS